MENTDDMRTDVADVDCRRILILGAGIAGLSAAEKLSRMGRKVVVIESSFHCGGTHMDQRIGPWRFDAGSIFYEDHARLFSLAPGLRDLCKQVSRVQRRIDPNGKLFHYPLEPRDVLNWKPTLRARAIGGLAAARVTAVRDGSLDAICRQRLGRTIYERTGLKNYVTRFHNVPPEQIDEEFFLHRMAFVERATRLSSILRSGWRALLRYPVRKGPPAVLRVRPAEGYDLLFNRVRAELESRGVTFAFGESLQRIVPPSEGSSSFLVKTSRTDWRGASVVSTVPLDVTHSALFDTPSGLQSLDLLTLFVTASWLDPGVGNVVFNFHTQGRWKRATIYTRLHTGMPETREALSVEVTLKPGAAPDPDAAFADFARHFGSLGFAEDLRLEGHLVVQQAYPIYRKGEFVQVQEVLARVAATGVITVGRAGRFDYLPTANAVILSVAKELEIHFQSETPSMTSELSDQSALPAPVAAAAP